MLYIKQLDPRCLENPRVVLILGHGFILHYIFDHLTLVLGVHHSRNRDSLADQALPRAGSSGVGLDSLRGTVAAEYVVEIIGSLVLGGFRLEETRTQSLDSARLVVGGFVVVGFGCRVS